MRTDAILPPGPASSPPVQMARWIAAPGDVLRRCRADHGDVFTLRLLGPGVFVVVADPALVKTVVTGDPDVLRAGEGNALVRPVVGERSVLTLDGDAHLRARKLLTAPFHGARMAPYAAITRSAAEDALVEWPRDRAAPVLPRMQELTLTVILRAVFGLRAGAGMEALRAALQRLLATGTSRLLMLASFAGAGRPEAAPGPVRRALAEVDRLLYAEIARRRAAGDAADRPDVLARLLREPMDDAEVRDELVTLLLAGHETTATALAWAFERLARHPEALDRLTTAVREGDGEAELAAVVHETLRVRPPVYLVARRLGAPLELDGWRLPAGITVTPSVYLLHRRADLYPDPEAFRPERFTGGTAPDTYGHLAFGGGRRRCLGAAFAGMELREVLRTVLREVDLAPEASPGELPARRAVVFAPARGGRVTIRTRRHRATAGGTGVR